MKILLCESSFSVRLFLYIRNPFTRNLYWDDQIAKQLSVLKGTQQNMAYAIGLHFGIVLAYLSAYLGVPMADVINSFIDPYGSVAEWLSCMVGTQEIRVRSQMSIVSRMLTPPPPPPRARAFEFGARSMIWTSNHKSIRK